MTTSADDLEDILRGRTFEPEQYATTMEYAIAYTAAGVSVVPIKRNGSKAPACPTWDRYKERLATGEELRHWFNRRDPAGIGCVSGKVSGNVELLDFDCDADRVFSDWCELVRAEAPALLAKLNIVRTPRKPAGYHVRYRCSAVTIPGNTKLAEDPAKKGKERTLIETRGEGGYALAPGCPPECHEERAPYRHVAGPGLTNLQDITAAERGALLRCARSFNRTPNPLKKTVTGRTGDLRPGDDYDRRGPDWSDILAGWTDVRKLSGGARYWRRPGKDGPGWSATTGVCRGEHDEELLHVFSSNAGPFEDGKSYGKFRAYALLNHNGDVSAAAKELARQGYGGQARGGKTHQANGKAHGEPSPESEPWQEPLLMEDPPPPPFPVECLPRWLAEWVRAQAEATQTPPDLAAGLALGNVAAAIAGKVRVQIRPGWQEPTNLFVVAALLPGERKSAVFAEAVAPVLSHEANESERMAPVIAAAESEHRILEAALKAKENKAVREEDPNERARLGHEAKQLAKELAAHHVPEPPQLLCDDVTPEKLSQLLARQGGKIFQASAEGTAFEIAKGRYSEAANFDVYLKGHAGDPLRGDRVSRERDAADQPALTCALVVQPDIIQGLAKSASMRGRGFLARWLYAMPASRVGRRKTAASAVPNQVRSNYRANLISLWSLPGPVQDGKPAAHVLFFSPEADQELRAFERWLEPQLAEGEELSYLAGWANKLAGAVARIAAVLQMAETMAWHESVRVETVRQAIAIGRDYLLPHAQAAFGVMGTDGATEGAKALWAWVCRKCEYSEDSESAPLVFHCATHTRPTGAAFALQKRLSRRYKSFASTALSEKLRVPAPAEGVTKARCSR
jgi:hypothetical protein